MAKGPRDDDTPTIRSRIGPTMRLDGELSGDEDVIIEGCVNGVVAPGHFVAIGPQALVSGEISGRVITVEGTVEGKLAARDMVAVLGKANVSGELSGSEVVLGDEVTLGDVFIAGKMGRSVRF